MPNNCRQKYVAGTRKYKRCRISKESIIHACMLCVPEFFFIIYPVKTIINFILLTSNFNTFLPYMVLVNLAVVHVRFG